MHLSLSLFRSMCGHSLSMTQPKMSSFLAKKQAFGSEWETSSRSSTRMTITGGRADWRTQRMVQLGSFHPQSYKSGEFIPFKMRLYYVLLGTEKL